MTINYLQMSQLVSFTVGMICAGQELNVVALSMER